MWRGAYGSTPFLCLHHTVVQYFPHKAMHKMNIQNILNNVKTKGRCRIIAL